MPERFAPRLHPAVRRYGPRALGLVVVVALFVFVLPRIADYGAVWDIVSDLTWGDVGILTAVTILNVVTPPSRGCRCGTR
jgi:hypothetical protein